MAQLAPIRSIGILSLQRLTFHTLASSTDLLCLGCKSLAAWSAGCDDPTCDGQTFESHLCSLPSIKGPDFANFWDFWILVNFGIFGPKMGPKGPGRASNGSREGLRFIWTKFQPKWAHLGPNGAPFCFSVAQTSVLGPNGSKSSLGPGPMWAQGPIPSGP